MRYPLVVARLATVGLLAFALLSGCQTTGAASDALAAEAITVTALDGPSIADAAVTATDSAGQKPRPRPETLRPPPAISAPARSL